MGTLVSIQIEADEADSAIEAAFHAVAAVHESMSFHQPSSELSRINRDAHEVWVEVSGAMLAVLSFGQKLSEQSGGVFDLSVAGALVYAGLLPPPSGSCVDDTASWRDIELDTKQGRIKFHKSLWIDLGGIAKGYAVDCAVTALQEAGVSAGVVNAGGDLRVFGDRDEPVRLRHGGEGRETPVIMVRNGALASSDRSDSPGVHRDGRGDEHASLPIEFCSVAASSCMYADALTKVVLAEGPDAATLLSNYEAGAALCDETGWRTLGSME